MKTMAMILPLLAAMAAAANAAEPGRPNILLVLADDLGYSDIGCYGGEIRTPNLDRLAAGGVRFTQFYNSARCCPTRASLVTGQYPHAVGFPHMAGSLPPTCVTIPEVLKTAGYRTYMVGKWHLGNPGPFLRGFDEFYGMLAGYGSFWNPDLYVRRPAERPARKLTSKPFYATDELTDCAIEFLADARKSGKPYFMYLAYNAPHFPLHAPKEDIDKYVKVYEQGWDAIRANRFARLRELGIIDAKWPLTPLSTVPPNVVATMHNWSDKRNPAWDSLDGDRRTDLARRMAIYAAMVDRMDQGIGRILTDLEKNQELANTLIFFLSDNGACAEWDPFGFDVKENIEKANIGTTRGDNVLHKGDDLAKMGQPGTYHSYGSAWANACNTPWRLYKHYSHEGGIATPLIVHWPAAFAKGNWIEPRIGHVVDLLATCVDVAGATYPKQVNGQDILPMEGKSLMPSLRGEVELMRTLCFEHEGSRAVRQGKWKLVAQAGRPWELYDMEADRVELHDLAAQQPERVREMAEQWDAWARRVHAGPHVKGGKK